MQYNEEKLKKVERLLNEIQQHGKDNLNEIHAIIDELNGKEKVYKTRDGDTIDLSKNFSEEKAQTI